jgi:signal transduction histidine kinase
MDFRLTILQKGLLLIAVPLVFQVIFIVFLIKIRTDGTRAVDWTIHTKDVIAQAQTGRVALLTAHGAIQGYLMTGDPTYGVRLIRLIAAAPGELEALERLVVDNPVQTHAAGELRARASRRRYSQSLLDTLELDFDRFVSIEREFNVVRQAQMGRSRQAISTLLFGGLAASLLCTSLVAIAYSRNISGRIAILTENTRRLVEGEELAAPIAGADEIAHLDRVFHEMAVTVSEASRRERRHARALERRAEELDAVNAQLRDKAQENEMFVYSVSHDLRSPLVNLQGFSKELQLIGGDLRRTIDKQEIPPEIRRQVQTMIEIDMGESITFIQTAVTRLSSIIDALLRLSRAGRVEYRIQRVEVETVVERVVSALRGTIEERKATIKVRDLPPASGDPTVIEQVFANLIGNALNYLDKNRPGQIEIFSVEADEQTPANCVVYAVKDNGLGIADQYKSKIFSAFQRLHGDVAKGEGVGLALVRRMVERHGGRVWFESEPGKGTTFFVAFQADIPEVEPTEPIIDEASPLVSMRTGNGRT